MPDGWMPLKIRCLAGGAATGAGAGSRSIVMAGECTGANRPFGAAGRWALSSRRFGWGTVDRSLRYHRAHAVRPRSHAPMSAAPLRIAVLGAGTVGRAVIRALL